LASYAIGDIQGCYDELQALLEKLKFSDSDSLWLVGDLVNRGPKSLETLRFIRQLGNRAKVVLGNHDLHLLAVHYRQSKPKKFDTFQDILDAGDCDELMDWLKSQPLAYFDPQLNAVMTHAGIPVNWSIPQALALAQEVQDTLQSEDFLPYFTAMYGNFPDQWQPSLTGLDRLRCITNYLTRMRFCTTSQQLELTYKGELGQQPEGLSPWFYAYPDHSDSTAAKLPLILFGHWAALRGKTNRKNIIALDTGCVWGEQLTAICIETQTRYSVPSFKQ